VAAVREGTGSDGRRFVVGVQAAKTPKAGETASCRSVEAARATVSELFGPGTVRKRVGQTVAAREGGKAHQERGARRAADGSGCWRTYRMLPFALQ